ncbi:MAG: DUF1902 domain-containing protein [Leptospiraceae bacterium]|nr:DUF1902 domain-containing protein [Leptospiraceae bacterium]
MMLEIHAEWDEDAAVWVATSEDIPGLITEAANIALLVERLKKIIPELMELNCGLIHQDFPFRIIAEQTATAQAA